MTKAGFQQQVHKEAARGLPGDKASLNPAVYADRNYLAGDGLVAAGHFVWADPANPLPGEYRGSGRLQALSSGTGQPLGIVERGLSLANYGILDSATLLAPEKAALNIVRRGDLYAVSSSPADRGQKVFAALADGSLRTAAAGTAVAGAVETAWSVSEGGAAGDLITISNWS